MTYVSRRNLYALIGEDREGPLEKFEEISDLESNFIEVIKDVGTASTLNVHLWKKLCKQMCLISL